MIRRPPRSTRTDTLFPYTTLFRSVSSGGSAIHTDRIGGIPDDMAKYREVLREAPNTQCIVYRATHNPRQGYTYTWSGYTGTPVTVVYPMETQFRVTVDLGQKMKATGLRDDEAERALSQTP